MKLLLASDDFPRIELLAGLLLDAGVPCETRRGVSQPGDREVRALWVGDENYRLAMMLFVGFASGAVPAPGAAETKPDLARRYMARPGSDGSRHIRSSGRIA
jgi:hypothetical protein